MEPGVFERELAMCRSLSQQNGGKCQWGECATCGVVPLLYKLGKGEFYEEAEAVRRLKEAALRGT